MKWNIVIRGPATECRCCGFSVEQNETRITLNVRQQNGSMALVDFCEDCGVYLTAAARAASGNTAALKRAI